MPKKKVEEPQVEALVEETINEPTMEELIEEAKEDALDPDKPVISMKQMSIMLTNQTFTIIAALGEGLISRYNQLTTNVPPKAKKSEYNKGYLRALNDVALGLQMYQDQITERAYADGVLHRPEDEQVPDLPEEYQTTVPEEDGKSE